MSDFPITSCYREVRHKNGKENPVNLQNKTPSDTNRYYVNPHRECAETIQRVLEEISTMYEERVRLEVGKHVLFDTTNLFKCIILERTKQDVPL